MIDSLIKGKLEDFKNKEDLREAIISAGGTILIVHAIKRILKGKIKISVPIELLAGKIIQDHPEWVLKSGEEAKSMLFKIIREYEFKKGDFFTED